MKETLITCDICSVIWKLESYDYNLAHRVCLGFGNRTEYWFDVCEKCRLEPKPLLRKIWELLIIRRGK